MKAPASFYTPLKDFCQAGIVFFLFIFFTWEIFDITFSVKSGRGEIWGRDSIILTVEESDFNSARQVEHSFKCSSTICFSPKIRASSIYN